eukprot:9498491-Pyramimonas_sp.AAC.1
MNPHWFRECALHECSHRAADLADRVDVFMYMVGRARPFWAPYPRPLARWARHARWSLAFPAVRRHQVARAAA